MTRKHNDVVYLWVYTDGYLNDDDIIEAVGRDSTGGGMDMETRERDLEFPFRHCESDRMGKVIYDLTRMDVVKRVEVHGR